MEAMYKDSGMKLTLLRVDGGMAANNLLMQMQADLVGINVGWCNALYIKYWQLLFKSGSFLEVMNRLHSQLVLHMV